jgi:hypothetical protein
MFASTAGRRNVCVNSKKYQIIGEFAQGTSRFGEKSRTLGARPV